MTDDNIDPRIQQLLDDGLSAYGRGDEDAAIEAWRGVVSLDPKNQQALDFLETAGAEAVPEGLTEAEAEAEAERTSGLLRTIEGHVLNSEVLLEHVRKRRYEAALRLLYEARAKDPADRAVSKSIQHLKRRLHSYFVEELGGLDGVPRFTGNGDDVSLGGDEMSTLELVDEISTVEDLVESSLLGRMRTLKALVFLTRRDVIKVRSGSTKSRPRPAVKVVAPTPPPSAPDVSAPVVNTPVVNAPVVSTPQADVAVTKEAPAPPPPDEYDTAFQLGMRAYVRRDLDQARKHFERCLELRPDDVRAKINLNRLASR